MPSAAQPPDVIGQWSLVSPLPYFPVHTHMLPTGKIMIWPGDEEDGGASGNDPRSWDPADQSVSSLSKPGYNTFYSGHSLPADGTLFVAGGHISTFVGPARASRYNPFTNARSNLPNMNAGRWYPTTTVLANGDVLVVFARGPCAGTPILMRKTTVWRAVCGKTARTVRRSIPPFGEMPLLVR